MKKAVLFLIVIFLTSPGCTTVKKKVRSVETLKYGTIVVMPFTEGQDADRTVLYNAFDNALRRFEEIKVVDQEKLSQQFVEELGLNHPLTTGAVDFTSSSEGNARRKKVHDLYGADAVIFGSLFEDAGVFSLAIQMLDVEDGSLTLSFSQDVPFKPEASQEALENLAKACVEKVMAHIRDNRVTTSVYKYE